jgi:PadR family transcriptional regulator, regulatory protein PadR
VARKQRRLSDEAATVLRLFLDKPASERFGLEIIRLTGIRSGSLYPILHRFEERDLVVASWEDLDLAAEQRRRPRRRYRLNPDRGADAAALFDEWAVAQEARRRQPERRLRPLGEAT